MSGRSVDAIVIGAGVIGSAIAWSLARAGLAVVVLERDAVAAHASRVAAGMLAPFAEAHGAEKSLPLGRESLERLASAVDELRERSGVDARLERCGILRVAADAPAAVSLRARAAELAEFGMEWWDAATARRHEPGLAPDVGGALWSPREGHVDAERLTRAYARAAESFGARFECGAPAVALERRGARVVGVRTPSATWSAGWVVIASGPWAGTALAGAPELPIRPVRGQLVELAGVALRTIVWDDAIYLVPRPERRVLAGATSEEVGFDCRVTSEASDVLQLSAARLVPALGRAPRIDARAGLRPASPDGLPLIGPHADAPGLLLAVGHHRNGILLSATTAALVTDLVRGAALPEAAHLFRPDRFAR